MALQSGQAADDILQAQGGDIPIGRLAEPEEIGAAIGFLCSPEAAYLTGQFLAVDGGYVLAL